MASLFRGQGNFLNLPLCNLSISCELKVSEEYGVPQTIQICASTHKMTQTAISDEAWRLSRLAMPAAPDRKTVTLPKTWTVDAGRYTNIITDDTFGMDEHTQKETKPTRKPVDENDSTAKLLCAPLLDQIIVLLLENVHHWWLGGNLETQALQAQKIAERFVLDLYDIPTIQSKTAYELNTEFLNTWHQRARVDRNRFFDLHPNLADSAGGRSTVEKRTVCNPDGTVDFWQAFLAHTAWRHTLFDTFSVSQACETAYQDRNKDEPAVFHKPDPVNTARIVYGMRMQEMATMLVLNKLSDILAHAKINGTCNPVSFNYQSLRRFIKYHRPFETYNPPNGDATQPLLFLTFLCRVLLLNMLTFRYYLSDANKWWDFHEHVRSIYEWASMRTGSLMVLLSTTSAVLRDAKTAKLYKEMIEAVHVYEICMLQLWVYVVTFDYEMSHTTLSNKEAMLELRKLICVTHISVHADKDEHLLLRHLTKQQSNILHEYFGLAETIGTSTAEGKKNRFLNRACVQASPASVCVLRHLDLASSNKHVNLDVFLTTDCLQNWVADLQIVDPAACEMTADDFEAALHYDVPLDFLESLMIQEADRRETLMDKPYNAKDTVEHLMQFSLGTMEQLRRKAKILGVN